MARHEFSRKTLAEAFKRANGHCEKCTAKLGPGNTEYDHIVPCELGGEATLDNCQVLCRSCHALKTGKQDVPAIRKSDRQRDKFNGAFKRKSKGFRTPRTKWSAPKGCYVDRETGQPVKEA